MTDTKNTQAPEADNVKAPESESTEAQAVAEILGDNADRLTYLVDEAIRSSNDPERTEAATVLDVEFIQALRQAVDLLTEGK
jgi:hypothetical protein